MQPMRESITGKENQGDLLEPFQTLVQFYSAFNSGSMTMMSQTLVSIRRNCNGQSIGGIKRGWNEIWEIYQEIFSGAAAVYVEFYDYTIYETNEIFYAVGRERGYF